MPCFLATYLFDARFKDMIASCFLTDHLELCSGHWPSGDNDILLALSDF